jgi:hypothetical protein
MELPQFVGTYLCDPLINLGITNAEKCTGWFISEVVLGTVFAWFFLQWIYVKLISKEHTNIPVLNVEGGVATIHLFLLISIQCQK